MVGFSAMPTLLGHFAMLQILNSAVQYIVVIYEKC